MANNWNSSASDDYKVKFGIVNTTRSLTLELAFYHIIKRINSADLVVKFQYITDHNKLTQIQPACLGLNPLLAQPIIPYSIILEYPRTGIRSIGDYFASVPTTQTVENWEAALAQQIRQLTAAAAFQIGIPVTRTGPVPLLPKTTA